MRGLQEILIVDLLDYMKHLDPDLDKKRGRLRVYNTFELALYILKQLFASVSVIDLDFGE